MSSFLLFPIVPKVPETIETAEFSGDAPEAVVPHASKRTAKTGWPRLYSAIRIYPPKLNDLPYTPTSQRHQIEFVEG